MKGEHSCLFPDPRGKVSVFSPLSMMIAMSLSCVALTMIRHVPSVFILLRGLFFFFNHKWILVFRSFSASKEIIIRFLFFILLLWCSTLTDLQMLNYPCILGLNLNWSRSVILLMYYWIQFANILLRILYICSSLGILACNFLFFWCPGIVLAF